MPRWCASSWTTVIQTSSARSSGSAKSSSSGSRNSVIRFGTRDPVGRPTRSAARPRTAHTACRRGQLVLAPLVGGRLVGDRRWRPRRGRPRTASGSSRAPRRRARRTGGGGVALGGALRAPASALGHGARILRVDGDPVARRPGRGHGLRARGVRRRRRRRAIGSTSSTGAGRRGGRARRPPGPRALGRRRGSGPRSRGGSEAPARSSRWTCAATACPTRRPRPVPTTSPVLAEDASPSPRAPGSWSPSRRTGSSSSGHGFGAIVAAEAAAGARPALRRARPRRRRLGATSRTSTGLDVDEFLRGLDEPPEVLRSMDAFLADRAAFDPATWDADQERAARATVVETHAGRVVPVTRPHVPRGLRPDDVRLRPARRRSPRSTRRSSRSSPRRRRTTSRGPATARWPRVDAARAAPAGRRSAPCRSATTGTT